MHSHFTVIFDACVCYPVHLRNILVQLATTGLFRARWTEEIHDEWIRNVLANNPKITQDQLSRIRELMNRSTPDCLVTGYESLIGGLNLPDPDDRHVLAAAIRCHAAVIVTTNLKDFPNDVLEPLGVIAQHPDEFITNLLDLDQEAVLDSIKTMRMRLKNPPITADELLNILNGQELTETVLKIQDQTESI